MSTFQIKYKYCKFYCETILETQKMLTTLLKLKIDCYLHTDFKEDSKIYFEILVYELNETQMFNLKELLMKSDVFDIQFK